MNTYTKPPPSCAQRPPARATAAADAGLPCRRTTPLRGWMYLSHPGCIVSYRIVSYHIVRYGTARVWGPIQTRKPLYCTSGDSWPPRRLISLSRHHCSVDCNMLLLLQMGPAATGSATRLHCGYKKDLHLTYVRGVRKHADVGESDASFATE
jgi:hypothetical protein